MMNFPDHETYRKLYARYYNGRDSEELLRLLKPIKGTNLLDLCGGDGRLTLNALKKGASRVVLVDAEYEMVPAPLHKNRKILVLIGTVMSALLNLHWGLRLFDRAVCRQGVNYWLNADTLRMLASVLKPQAVFVFNTFNQKPPKEPRVLEYKMGGHSFAEVSWLIGDKVHHLQVRDGLKHHHTEFKWLSPEEIRKLLERYFEVEEIQDGKTSLYRCVKF